MRPELPVIATLSYRLVLERHARLTPNGNPVRCFPSPDERWGVVRRKETKGSDGKVIFDGEEAAMKAAEEFERLGLEPQRAYPCRRSKRGHYHLARVRKP